MPAAGTGIMSGTLYAVPQPYDKSGMTSVYEDHEKDHS